MIHQPDGTYCDSNPYQSAVATSVARYVWHDRPAYLIPAFTLGGAMTLLRSLGFGVILGAAYMLYLYRRVIFGRITRDDLRNILHPERGALTKGPA